MPHPDMLFPILALITWTCVMWVWMYATRIPAMQKAGVDVEDLSRTGGQFIWLYIPVGSSCLTSKTLQLANLCLGIYGAQRWEESPANSGESYDF